MEIKRRDILGGIGGAFAISHAHAEAPVAKGNKKAITLSTHILDMVSGKPAGNVKVVLYQDQMILSEGRTNNDGRCVVVRNDKKEFAPGYYQLAFYVADYFKAKGYEVTDPPFLNIVRIDFGIAKNSALEHYHVPLLLSPYGFSTYKGS